MKRSRWVAAALIAAATMSAAAWAEDVWVQSKLVVVRANKGPAYAEVATVKKGDKLNVVAREGAWIKVSVGGKEGFIPAKAISNTQIAGDMDLSMFKANTARVDTSNAGKGVSETAQKFAQGRGMSHAAVEQLEKFRDAIRDNPREWEAFMQQGRVGIAAQ